MITEAKPWLSLAAQQWLGENVTNEWTVLEFGSGKGSIWFLQRCKELFTFEHDKAWADKVLRTAEHLGYKNLHMYHRPRPYCTEELMNSLPNGEFDFVLVDGQDRLACAQASYQKVKPGGYFAVDDINRRDKIAYYKQIIREIEGRGWERVSSTWPAGCQESDVHDTWIWRRPC